MKTASLQALKKLHPLDQIRNPVMCIVFAGAILSAFFTAQAWKNPSFSFYLQLTLWLVFTVLFANFAEALAEGKGKAQAESLRKQKQGVTARLLKNGVESRIAAEKLKPGDHVICEAGDLIPGDGMVVEGIASVNEAAVTGESAPVIRENGGDRSGVTGGTQVISDRLIIEITSEPGNTFLDRLIGLIEGAQRQKTPNEIALSIILFSLTILFIVGILSLKALMHYSESAMPHTLDSLATWPVLIALLVCLIPTTIGALLSAISISGMDRMIRKNVIATSGRAVEAAGDIDVLLLDKTGTITLGNRMATAFFPAAGVAPETLALAAQLSSFSDPTPEGRSIVVLAKNQFNLRSADVHQSSIVFIPFSAQTRMSGIDLPREDASGFRRIRKGSLDAIEGFLREQGESLASEVVITAERIAREGGTPLLVAEDAQILGVIQLKDVVKKGIREKFSEMRRMGIRTIMITGDNPLTAAAIAAEAGVDDFIAEATPEGKLQRIRDEQKQGKLVAMIGDGTNDAPALAQADVGVAMNSGTQAAREAGNMVDLDNNPTKLIEIVETGKQLLMTRGALTTFSISNDIAKYFAILPALFTGLYATAKNPNPFGIFNVMGLASPQSAILSATIFNAIIIVLLIPLALRGVQYKPMSAKTMLWKNFLIYGVGGLVMPFVGIKVIDTLIHWLRWV